MIQRERLRFANLSQLEFSNLGFVTGRLVAGRPDEQGIHEFSPVIQLTHLGRHTTDQPAWAALMARKRRKTLVVCGPCHQTIHGHTATQTA